MTETLALNLPVRNLVSSFEYQIAKIEENSRRCKHKTIEESGKAASLPVGIEAYIEALRGVIGIAA